MADRPFNRLDWIAGLFLLLGLAGFGASAFKGIRELQRVEAKGSFWETRDRDGRVKRMRQSRHLALENGEALVLQGPGITDITFTGQRRESSTFLEFAGASWRFIVDEDARKGILLGRDEEILFQDRRSDFIGLPFQPLKLRLLIKNGALSAEINGKEALPPTEIPQTGGELTLIAREGKLRLDRIVLGDGAVEEFTSLYPVPPWPRLGMILLQLLLFIAATALFLRSFCMGRPPATALVRAATRLFFPASLYFCLGFFITVRPDSWVLLPLFAVGLVMAFVPLRGHVRALVPQGRVRASLVSIACLAALCLAGSGYRAAFFAAALEAEQAAQARTAPAPYLQEKELELGPQNAETVDRVFRNADLEAAVTLGEGAILQVRVRAPEPGWHDGISLFVSSDPRFETGFYLETKADFKPMGKRTGPLPHGEKLDLEIHARGRNFEAVVNGQKVSASSRIFPEGAVVFLAAKGFVRVAGLKVRAVDLEEGSATSFPDRVTGAAVPLAFVLLFAVLAAGFLRLPAIRVMEASAFSLLPVAYCFFKLSPSGAVDPLLIVVTLLLSSLFLFIFLMVHSSRLKKLNYFALVLVIVLGDALVVGVTRPRAWPVDHVHISRLSLADWSVDQLHDDLAHLEHPLLRRWNVYLAQHELRDRSYSLKKSGGTRILALGTSSTHGYWVKAPYPFCLEHLLKAEGHDVEMIIGAYPGATGPRLFPFFKNVLLEFEPDIVTLSLYYNDAYALTQFDESGYLAEVTEKPYSLIDAVRARLEFSLGAGLIKRFEKRFEENGELPGDAPVRFEAMLRDYAALAREKGVKLVLIKEPVSGDMDRLWKREFRDAMDRVGAEYSIPVIDPTPLLLERGGESLFMDNVHPFLEGGIVIAEAMLPALRDLLAP